MNSPVPTTKTHKYWKLAASENHQPHRFLQYIENIKLNGDSISHLRQFYKRIRLAFQSSFTKVADIIPAFKDVSPHYPFGHILVPENEFYLGYHSIHNTYNWFGTALLVWIFKEQFFMEDTVYYRELIDSNHSVSHSSDTE